MRYHEASGPSAARVASGHPKGHVGAVMSTNISVRIPKKKFKISKFQKFDFFLSSVISREGPAARRISSRRTTRRGGYHMFHHPKGRAYRCGASGASEAQSSGPNERSEEVLSDHPKGPVCKCSITRRGQHCVTSPEGADDR